MISKVSWFLVACAVVIVTVGMCGCNGAIPIDPEIDPCSIEGVEECCIASEPCDTLPAFRRGYDQGWDAAMGVCDEEREDEDSDTEKPAKRPRKHKKPPRPYHHKPKFNLDSNDPLEGLQVSQVQQCEVVCITQYGVTTCQRWCNGVPA